MLGGWHDTAGDFNFDGRCSETRVGNKEKNGIITGEGEEMEGGDGKEGSESECWHSDDQVLSFAELFPMAIPYLLYLIIFIFLVIIFVEL